MSSVENPQNTNQVGSNIHIWVIVLFTLFYLTWNIAVVGFRVDHLSFLVFILLMFFANSWTRMFTYLFVFFILFWIIYDSMRAFPNYLVNDVHILEPYTIEKQLFGISTPQGIQTPNEFMASFVHPILDFLTGFFYLTWVPVPLALSVYLFFKDKPMLLRFTAAYLFTNILGFVIYYSYPAAPPWYFQEHGNEVKFEVLANAAELVRFDHLIGFPLFENMYTKNSNVFAAIPSLHAAYPIVTWYYARKKGLKIASVFIFLDIVGIWFAAIYSNHHYVIDLLLGLSCAVIAIAIFEGYIMKTRFAVFLEKYVAFASTTKQNVT